MLRQRIFRRELTVFFNSCRNYLSHEYKNVATTGYQTTFLSKISQHEEKSKDAIDVAKQFNLLRSRTLQPAALDSAGYAVISYFLQNANTNDLVAVIANRLDYGVFLTPFSAAYLLDHYLEAKEFSGAAQIAIEAALQEILDNELVATLAIKACFAYMQASPEVEPPVSKPEGKVTEVKVRVKFVRNPVEFKMGHSQLSKALFIRTLKALMKRLENADVQNNCKLMVSVLANNVEDIKSMKSAVCKDVLAVCQEMAKENADVTAALAELQTSEVNFHDQLENMVKQVASKEENKLMQQQLKDYEAWVLQYEQDLEEEKLQQNRIERQQNIEAILADIKEQRQKLWFFEEEDKIDLQIYNKRPKYVKRWFGKKKKPRVIDENYIPPEIRS